MVDRELNVVPAMADNFRVSTDGLDVPLPAQGGRALERRRAGHGRGFRLRLGADARGAGDHCVPPGGRRDGRGPRRPHARGAAAEPRSYFPYVLCSTWAFPLAEARVRVARRRLAQAREPRRQRPVRPRRVRRRARRPGANPHFVGARGNVRRDRDLLRPRARPRTGRRMGAKGRFDLLHVYDPGPATSREHAQRARPGARAHRTSASGADVPPFSNELVRKAFSHAVDRDDARRRSASASSPRRRTGGAIPPAMPGHSHRVGPEYDLEQAAELLAEAGYPDGKGLPELEPIVASIWLRTSLEPLASPVAQGDRRARRPCATSTATSGGRARGRPHVVVGLDGRLPDPDGFFRGLLRSAAGPSTATTTSSRLLERARSLRDQGERMRALPRDRPPLGRASTRRSSRSSTRARCSCAARGSRVCGRARSRGCT